MLASLRRFLRDKIAQRLRVPSIDSCLQHLSSVGFSPEGIYDVGAYRGDFARQVLNLWPKTKVTCFEPLPQMAESLNDLSAAFPDRVQLQPSLLGDRVDESVDFHVGETASSVLEQSGSAQHPVVQIPMTTLDRHALTPGRWACSLLKLDVQGFELSVLKGAVNLLDSEIDAILVELNLLAVYRGVPLMHEVIGWLAEHEFVAYDIGGLMRRPLDGALWQMDLVFVKRDGIFRQDCRWSA